MYTDEKSMQMDKDADKFGWIKSLGRRIDGRGAAQVIFTV